MSTASSARNRAQALEHLTAALEKEQVDLVHVEQCRAADLSEWELQDDDARVSDVRQEVAAEVVIFGSLYTWGQKLPPWAG